MRFAPMLMPLLFVAACGSSKDDDKPANPPAPPASGLTEPQTEFARDVDPILQRNCGGCHTPGAKHLAFVGNEELFKASADMIAGRLNAENPKVVMPPPRAREPLAAEDKAKLLTFLGR